MIFVASLGMMKDIVIIKRRTKQVKPVTSIFQATDHINKTLQLKLFSTKKENLSILFLVTPPGLPIPIKKNQ